MKKVILTFFAIAIFVAALSGCSAKPGELVVYSARNESFVLPLTTAFEQQTGIKVRLLTGNEALVNKLGEEKNNVQADIFFSNDAGAMEFLRLQGLLQANKSPAVAAIDPLYRSDDGSWVGLSARTRVLIYNTDLISEENMPKSLWELTDPKWEGQFMITRGGNGSMVAHVAALRVAWGDERTTEWLTKVRANAGVIVSGHTDIRRAVGSGEYKFGLVNNYYYHLQLAEDKDNNVGAIYPDQGADGMGAFVNAAGVALIKGAPNSSNAKKFVDFLLQPEQQRMFAFNNKEVPLVPGVETVSEAKRIDEYKVMSVRLQDIGAVWADVKALIEAAGLDWDLSK
ncbi:MAG: iron(III) transport system substrate-binding protein [Bacillota bacterium]|nr:MAG: iron(III) transport system substrate-binding protein [Bacillota bacterium]MBS3949867.1 extracellular solute-binding protein [Peptococcaceae bacterium]